jgi:hypothetical protein
MPTEISTIRDDHALEGLRRELSAARQQLATVAEISRSIRGSRNDLQAVFDGIVHSAVRLLRGNASTLSRIVGNGITLAATASTDVACDRVQGQCFPLARFDRGDARRLISINRFSNPACPDQF